MAGDIEAFLRMAAERRRQAQGGAPAPVPQNPTPAQPTKPPVQRPQPPTEQERRPLASTLKPSVHEAEVVDAVLDDSPPYQPTRPSSQPTPNNRQKGKQKHKPPAATVAKTSTTVKPQVAPSIPQSQNQIEPIGSESKQRGPGQSLANRVVDMVRNPNSVASAFILTEILKPIDWDRED